MATKVLVTYASKYGATAEIAEKIGEVIGQGGLTVDVLPVDEVRLLNPYRAVVLGSALYIGRWQKGARRFLKRYEHKLAEHDVWVFLSGPTGESTDDTREAWHLSRKLAASLEHINPHDIEVFSGAIQLSKLTSLEKWMIKQVKAPVADFRDWAAISAWAEGIASEVKRAQSQLT